ncbi:tetratricopeptide repeat protein [Pseudoduganella sp. HUAS MS19]
MSLINKMLRDLDARGSGGTREGAASQVRPVSHRSRGGLSPLAIGAGAVVLALLGIGGFAAWKYLRGVQQPVAPPAVAVARTPQAVPAQPGAQKSGPVAAAVGDEGPAVVPADIPPEAHRAAGEKMAREMEERNAAARRAAEVSGAMPSKAAAVPERDATQPTGPAPERFARARSDLPAATGAKPDGDAASRVAARNGPSAATASERQSSGRGKGRVPAGQAAAGGAAVGGAIASDGPEAVGSGLSPQQKAENEYRRALAKLQDARVSEALVGLERALGLYPRHEAARQTLVSLLIESGRNAEAIHHLALATSLDPRQASMAMLLARLQIENGGNALETLQRSLPYAESNPEFRAMVAGVLQRANRHNEAVEHYQAAVRLQPTNAVWWMGMGISLQADKRNGEAKAAFQRAAESGRLTPDLQAFVERRLQQVH